MINRRDFLKFSSLLSTVFIVQTHPLGKKISSHVEVEAQGMIYRGTNEGHILVSHDAGRTWQNHLKLGRECSIEELFLDRTNRIRAQVGFAGHSFDLVLSDNGSSWQTA
jgi:hypothetical protein